MPEWSPGHRGSMRVRRSDPSAPGFSRLPGRTPRYVDATGSPVDDAEVIARIEALVIPPAWLDVWISPYPNGHIQAVGTDAAGRRQYLYHEEWRRKRDAAKFDRMLELAAALPGARRTVTRDLRLPGVVRERTLAAAFRMIDRAALRIGEERYRRAYGTRGLTTLLCRDITVDGAEIELRFPSKSGQGWDSSFRDPELAEYLAELTAHRRAGARLLAWRDARAAHDRRWHTLRPLEVNEDIRLRTGVDASAKDFRTLRGTIIAADALARAGVAETRRARDTAEREAVRLAASALGNTPAVARASYIDPRVFDRYRNGELLDVRRSPEAALVTLLA
ncbi:DNA topoisomerase IB [Gryllotalpicola koreensis]|uniref:DNA topoisomerase n=1 Tax=Gryllotalpicola koreensis TaxID=993086 RepID=A0ABP8A9Z2_9MICO